jgi:hypothetical protein
VHQFPWLTSTSIDELKAQNDMSSLLSVTAKKWSDTIIQSVNNTFRDKDALYAAITDGAMLDPDASMEAFDVGTLTNIMQHAMFSYMTPNAWKYANPRVGAFIA